MHLQVYSSLAYGGRGIAYFTYFAPPGGNFRMAAVDAFDHRTSTWNRLRRINDEICELAPCLVKLRSTGVYHLSPVPTGSKPLAESTLVKNILANTYQSPPVATRYLIGEFLDLEGPPFLMIVNKDLEQSVRFEIQLKQANKHLALISPYTGKEGPLGEEMGWLAPGAGMLFEVE